MWTSFLLSEELRTSRTIFQCYHTGPFMAFAVQNLHRFFIFSGTY